MLREGIDEVFGVNVAVQSRVVAAFAAVPDALAELESFEALGEAEKDSEGGAVEVAFFEMEIL